MPFYAFLLGTDVLERFFDNVRLLRSNNDMDSLDMLNYMRALDGNSAMVRKSYCSPDAHAVKDKKSLNLPM